MSLAESPATVADSRSSRSLDAACLAVLAAAHAPFLYHYFARLWSTPHYDFFPLALAGAVYLGWRERSRLGEGEGGEEHRATPAFVFGAVLLVLVVLFESLWLAYVSFLWHLGAITWRIGGSAACRAMLPAGLMSLTFLRLPLRLDQRLVQVLQGVTARCSSAVLDVLDVLHLRAGNVIEIPGRRLLVEEACSGVNSLYAAGACTLFFVLWRRMSVAQSALLLVTVPFWTVVANSTRVVLTAVLRYRWDIAADEGRLHDALGAGVFAVAMLLILSTASGIEFLRRAFGGRPHEVDEPESTPARPVRFFAGRRIVPIAAVAFALAICALQVPGTLARIDDDRAWRRLTATPDLGAEALPAAVGEYRRERFEIVDRGSGSALGEMSQTWYYDGPQTRSAASLDYPFFGWHEITECYLAQGWLVDSRSLKKLGDGTTVVEVLMHQAERAEFGHLVFLLCDPTGEPIPAWTSQRMPIMEEWYERGQIAVNLVRGAPRPEHRTTAQFQLFTEAFTPPDEARSAELRGVYERLWSEARAQLARNAEASP